MWGGGGVLQIHRNLIYCDFTPRGSFALPESLNSTTVHGDKLHCPSTRPQFKSQHMFTTCIESGGERNNDRGVRNARRSGVHGRAADPVHCGECIVSRGRYRGLGRPRIAAR